MKLKPLEYQTKALNSVTQYSKNSQETEIVSDNGVK